MSASTKKKKTIKRRKLKRPILDTSSGKPFKEGGPGKKLPESFRIAILAQVMFTKKTHVQIAEEFGISKDTVSNVKRQHLRQIEKDSKESGIDIRGELQILNEKAIEAVKAGLDYKKDPYRRGTLGKDVLKGTGIFKPDNELNLVNNQTTNVAVIREKVPEEFQDRYLQTIEAEAEEVEVADTL